MGEKKGPIRRMAGAGAAWAFPRPQRRLMAGSYRSVYDLAAGIYGASPLCAWLMTALIVFNAVGLVIETMVPGAHAQALGAAAGGAGAESIFGFSALAPDSLPLRWLADVFGPLPLSHVGGGGGSGPTTVIPKLLNLLNASIFAVAAFLALYSVVMAIGHTAHTGEPISKSQDWMWPVRIAIALGMLVPAASGFSAAQLVALNLGILGANGAQTLWEKSITAITDTTNDPGGAAISAANVPEPEAAVRAFLSGLTCAEATKIQAQYLGSFPVSETVQYDESSSKIGGGIFTSSKTTQESRVTISWGGGAPSGISPTACGAVTWVNGVTVDDSASTTDKTKAATSYLLAQQATAAQAAALDTLREDLRPMARRIALATAPGQRGAEIPTVAEISTAVSKYKVTVARAITTAVNQANGNITKEWAENAKSSGWVYAGTWWLTISNLQGQVLSLARAEPKVTAIPNYGGMPDSLRQIVASAVDQANVIWNDRNAMGGRSTPNPSTLRASTQSAADNAAGTPDEWSAKVAGWLGDVIKRNMSIVKPDSTNPIGEMMRFGHTLVEVATLAWVAPLPFAAIPFLGGAVQYAAWGITAIAIALGSAGGMLAYALPLTPTIIWFFGVLTWFSLLLSAVLGFPLWFLTLVATKVGGLHFNPAAGIATILKLLFLPPMMVVGLYISVAFMPAAISFVGHGMEGLSAAYNPTSLSGLVGMVMWYLIYAGVMIATATFVFGLINSIPAGALALIDAGVDLSAASADRAERATGGHGRALGSAAARPGGKLIETKDKDKGKDTTASLNPT